jgi:integrase
MIPMPTIAPPPLTFEDVIEALSAMPNLTPARRRDLVSGLRTMARFIGRDIEQVPANTEWLRQRLRQLHPRQLGVSEKRFQNVKSAVLTALRMAVANNKRLAAFPEMSAAFQELYDAVTDRMAGYKLSRFFRYCSAKGLSPADVDDGVIAAFEADLIAETLHKDPSKVARDTVLTWNKMVDLISVWPQNRLTRVSKRVPWTFPLEAFLASFVEDVDRWCGRLGHEDLFDEDAPLRPSRPATIKHRRFQIRMMASAIVHSGIDISLIRALTDLVEIENFKRGIRFMLERKEGKVTEAIFTLASGIKAIARHHAKVDDAHLNELRRLCSKLDRSADRYRKKNKDRLDQFDDLRNLAMLLSLPQHLARLAQKPGPKPRSAALYLQSAVAIEILLFCPMRIGNLANLDLERHLRWIEDKTSLRLVIDIPGEEVKNGKPLRYELAGPSARMVRNYIDGARKALSNVPTTAVFPKLDGTPRNPGDLSHQIKRHCFQRTGLVVNAHLFRSLASKIHNLVAAGDAATISHVLGDKISTVMRAYTQFEQKSALDYYQNSVRKVRANDDDDDGSDAA